MIYFKSCMYVFVTNKPLIVKNYHIYNQYTGILRQFQKLFSNKIICNLSCIC